MTDVRRAAVTASEPPAKHRRPGMTRRQTPVSSQKLGRSHRERERELEYRDSWHDERESFPQFWYVASRYLYHDLCASLTAIVA